VMLVVNITRQDEHAYLARDLGQHLVMRASSAGGGVDGLELGDDALAELDILPSRWRQLVVHAVHDVVFVFHVLDGYAANAFSAERSALCRIELRRLVASWSRAACVLVARPATSPARPASTSPACRNPQHGKVRAW
jgi:hypothetical protein